MKTLVRRAPYMSDDLINKAPGLKEEVPNALALTRWPDVLSGPDPSESRLKESCWPGILAKEKRRKGST